MISIISVTNVYTNDRTTTHWANGASEFALNTAGALCCGDDPDAVNSTTYEAPRPPLKYHNRATFHHLSEYANDESTRIMPLLNDMLYHIVLPIEVEAL